MGASPDDIDTRKLTLGTHLEELRGHVFKSIGWLALALTVCLCFQDKLMEWATWPHIETMEKLREKARLKTASDELPSSSVALAKKILDASTKLDGKLSKLAQNHTIYEERSSADPGKALAELLARQEAL